METFLIKAVQLLLSLSLLVVIHEFGHFLFARLFKIRVEKFYLFFNPWFSLFKFKPKGSDTEYGIGWLPLGGYVKISGMIDESMDTEQMAQPAKPWEFRSKPAWQRLLVMFGGVLFNFILALFIFSMMVFAWGDNYVPLKSHTGGMTFSKAVKQAGFEDGDVLVSADGEQLNRRFGILSMNTYMAFIDADEVGIIRKGEAMTIKTPEWFADSIVASKMAPYEETILAVVTHVAQGSEAERIGLQIGDNIVSANGVSVISQNDVTDQIRESANSGVKQDNLELKVVRAGEEHTLLASIDSTSMLGFSGQLKGESINDKYGFFASFPMGWKLGTSMLKSYVAQSRFIFSKEGAKSVGGFGSLGNLFPPAWNWFAFWTMTAFLSIVLAFMNLLPIPMLDGGHIVFLFYEVITGRTPNEKFQEYAQLVGMIFIFGLLLLANGNDIVRYIFN